MIIAKIIENFHLFEKLKKGVASINNCWGGEGPVFNPDYMCGAQYMITEGSGQKNKNFFQNINKIIFH